MPSIPEQTLGPFLIGVLVTTSLWGITNAQLYLYTTRVSGPRDSRWIQALVWSVWALETFHTACLWRDLYRIAVEQYGELEALLVNSWATDISTGLINSLIGVLVQSFFAYRVYILSESIIVPLISWLLSAMRMACGIGITIETFRVASVIELLDKWKWMLMTLLAITACVDILNSASLCYCLFKRGSTGVRRTMLMVNKILLWTLENCIIISIFSVLELILLATMTNYAWLCISAFNAELYSNSLLASLNARTYFSSETRVVNHSKAGGSVMATVSRIQFEQFQGTEPSLEDSESRSVS